MIPFQDSPAIKQTYTAVIFVDDPDIDVFMTANKTLKMKNEFRFESKIQIPGYNIAILAGRV